uniref:ribosomal protein L22 n=1 Tax=Huperzia arctica TaxID=669708 RepID=UPI0023D8A794|nr:ribosomal protein L22 [Huperzia arctica]WDR47037.1 ribosomal protein L22 [Huperzia arctica]
MKIGNDSNKEVKIFVKNIHMSAYKLRRVVNQIRGHSYGEAVMILEFMPYRACYPVLKLVSNAAENANRRMGLRKADLFVSEVKVDAGSFAKRLRLRAQGRNYPIHKPTCHITIILKKNLCIRRNYKNNIMLI